MEFIDAPNYRAARRAAPWAAVIARVEGGWLAFRLMPDYETWKHQR